MERRARDPDLLDALDAHAGVSFEGEVWRIVREEREPLQGYPSRARWDPGTFDVLYTSLEREGALEEIHFHLSRQPVFPSKIRSVLHRILVRTERTLRIADLAALEALGVSPETYGSLSYERTQEIGDAAAFLGFDGILAPSARWPCQNLVLFTERFTSADLRVVNSEPVDWADWRTRRNELRRTNDR
ncbi:RES family NAD+ phosphorylase [Mesorhizobium sp. M1405]|uniref:RES family NAD+ phosphorylase n=1 Tax=unclassified Mesorhizobium TaxID=325217 RepID=UPI003334AB35